MTKRFLICGDSWGVGAYRYVGKPPTAIETIENTGLDYFLTQQGYEVVNISRAADSNYIQLNSLIPKLETGKYDYIIWVQTEPNRDILDTVLANKLVSAIQYPSFDMDDYVNTMAYIKDRNYHYAQCIYDRYKVPFFVIGGLSSVDPSIANYTFAHKIIPSWLNDLTEGQYDLAENMHQNIILQVLEAYPPSDKSFMLYELDKMKVIEESLETHPNFSDGVHPNSEQYKKLAIRILNELELQSQAS